MKQYYDHLYTQKNSSTEEKECIFQYFLNATLHFAFSFFWIVRLCGHQNKNHVITSDQHTPVLDLLKSDYQQDHYTN